MVELIAPASGDRELPSSWLADTVAYWSLPVDSLFTITGSASGGLTSKQAAARLTSVGPNAVERARRGDPLALLLRQFESPIVLILVFATIVSGALGDVTDATIILAIIVLSGLLGFWQERGATRAVEALLALVRVTSEVRRDGGIVEVPLAGIVPGDVVELQAGDLVPADGLVLESNNALVDESSLTGESYPVEKSVGPVPAAAPIARRTNSLFLGTHIASGSATALIVRTGPATAFGRVSADVRARAPATSFELGLTAFGYLLMRAMIVLVVAIFVVNVVLARPLIDSALFSLALAVGLTPQLLPAIVTIGLAHGARAMARERVIVKRLDAIEDFGAMSILCTDKTGTLTVGAVVLDSAIDLEGTPSLAVRRWAYLNASLQHGFRNPIDAAIVTAGSADPGAARVLAEIPYDFTRRRLTILVDDGGSRVAITKGALDNVLAVCATGRLAGAVVDLATVLPEILRRYESLSADGYRVLGVATCPGGPSDRLLPGDEAGMTFEGFVTFLDPPKPGIEVTLRDLAAAGISVRMITGDNRLVAAHVGAMAGLGPAAGPGSAAVLTGDALAGLSDAALAEVAGRTLIFAEIEPTQKERIIRALRASGQIVGYLGDGINDAPALHAADVGLSVDTAVDVAKESAAIVLLEKDLQVLLDGVREGRRTFANTMKYVYTTTSANFGNMLSMAVAAAVLPFLPLLADQILLVNFLTDFPATTIATDEVDPEQLQRPHRWDIGYVRNFMLLFGLTSSVFDILTFIVLRVGFGADATLFRSGWFLESVATEIAVLFVLRTRRPFLRSRPSPLLALSSVLVAVVTLAIPYSPAAGVLGLDALPPALLVTLVGVTVLYVAMTEFAKHTFNALIDRRDSPPDSAPAVQPSAPGR